MKWVKILQAGTEYHKQKYLFQPQLNVLCNDMHPTVGQGLVGYLVPFHRPRPRNLLPMYSEAKTEITMEYANCP